VVLLGKRLTYYRLIPRRCKVSDRYYAFIPQTTVNSKELNSIPATARWIYVVMVAERHGLDAPFEIPYTEIRRITGFSKPTISQAITELETIGFLEYEHGGLECNPNVYDLDAGWLML